MRGNNILGLILSNMHDERIPELTSRRTMGSVPFGGKYRLIDFPLSNMSNSGINNVGIVAKINFLSLMDHVRSGNAWDLSRRRSGLTVLPPFGENSFATPVEAIYNVYGYLQNSPEEYILLTNSDCVTNIDYQKMYSQHVKTNADVTLVYKKMLVPEKDNRPLMLDIDSDNFVKEICIKPDFTGIGNYSIGMLLTKKELLLKIVKDAISTNLLDFKRMLQADALKHKYFGFEAPEYCQVISSMNEYFRVNMNLMDQSVREQLFNKDRPIYTKVRDDIPCRYGLGSMVKNSLVAQGCVIDGEVTNSILSKGVYVGKGAKISNCIIMQDTKISANTNLKYVIIDKDVVIKEDRSLMGFESYPIFIAKQSIV